MGNRPDHFRQYSSQVGIAMGRFAAEPFTATLFIAWTDSRPRRQVLGTRKTAHVHSNLCQDSCRSGRLNAGHTLDKHHGLLEGLQVLLHGALELSQGRLQKVNVSQQLPEHEAMMGQESAFQRALHLRDLFAQHASRQLGQHFGIRRPVHSGLQPVASTFPEHVSGDRGQFDSGRL